MIKKTNAVHVSSFFIDSFVQGVYKKNLTFSKW